MNNTIAIIKICIGIGFFTLTSVVIAHATLEEESAESGSTYRAVMRISHGCEGSPTHTVRIQIPDGVQRASPMPKPGWELNMVVEELDEPYQYYESTITEDTREITWSGGSLKDEHYDEFIFRARLPETDEEMIVYFPTVQACENGEFHRWIEIPQAGEDADELEAPAPSLTVHPLEEAHQH